MQAALPCPSLLAVDQLASHAEAQQRDPQRLAHADPALPPSPPPPRSFQWREQCHKCGIAKESVGIALDPSAAAGGYSAGYSADPYAADPYASYGTGAAAGGGGGGGGGLQSGQNVRPGDWRCLGCGNVK